MPKELTRQQVSSGLTYVANTPKFLQNFGKPQPVRSPPPDHHGGSSRDVGGRSNGREPIPERPRDGKWASGSDNEEGGSGRKKGREEEESDDEWGDVYGGGGDDGPQVVVLKEGRHLTADEVKRERRRAMGKPSESPPPPSADAGTDTKTQSVDRKPHDSRSSNSKIPVQIPKLTNSSAKRKLVGGETESKSQESEVKGKKKKKKVDKGLLSFDEAEGES